MQDNLSATRDSEIKKDMVLIPLHPTPHQKKDMVPSGKELSVSKGEVPMSENKIDIG